ncbi:MAG: FAD-dependent oxidoreductase [Chloroflexota bacterium]|nr:MAG: FAD-dependent oxidoreductase [Chloroflexota bacterium]
MLPKTSDVVIIGGGVMGASVAYHLAERGGVSVTLLEQEEQFGLGSTGRCAGGIRHQFSTEVNIRLSIESIQMMERFPEEIGQEIGLNLIGYLFVLDNEQDFEQFKRNVALQHSLGIESTVLSVDDIHRRVPLLNLEGVVGGTIYERDGLADPNSIVQGYINKTRQLKQANPALAINLLNHVTVTNVRMSPSGRVQAVMTNEGEIATETVVIAAGAWSGRFGETVGVNIPIVPVRRQIAVTTPIRQLPPDFPFVLFFGQSLYFHPESGQSILTGKSNSSEPVGFNTEVDPKWTETHLLEAMHRFPLLEQAGLLSEWAGLYEVTPDEQAILGRLPGVEGVIMAAGFSGHGFMHGPIVGKLMAEEILEGRAYSINIDDLRYERFALGKDVSEYNIV